MSIINRPLISLCMIVKNEEKNIVHCLQSVKNYVDEIIVLDTGSTDRTPLLAEKLGAKVFYANWEEDFSKARNLSKQYARGEWIFFLDADEVLPPQTGQGLKELTKKNKVEGYTFRIINYTSSKEDCQKQIGINLRMFRNNPNYIFEGALHEQVKPSILRTNPNAVILHCDSSILHYGYCKDHTNRKEKNLRNIAILQKVLKENPTDHFNHYNLAVSYYVNGQLEKAKTHFQLAKHHASDKLKYPSPLFRNFAVCLFDLGQYEDALNLLNEGIAQYPDYPDLYYLQGQIYVALKLFNEAKNCFNRCLKFTKVNPEYISTHGVTNYLSYEYLADISMYQQNWPKALDYQLKAAENGAKTLKSMERIAFFAKENFKDNERTWQFLAEIFKELDPDAIIKILFNINCYELVIKEFTKLQQPEAELIILGAKACMYLKDWQSAEKYLIKISSDSPYYQEALILGFICCCLQFKDGTSFIKNLHKKNLELAEACKCINNLFTNVFRDYPITNHYIKLVYQLMLFDFKKTVQLLEDNSRNNFPYLCFEAGRLAFKEGVFTLAQDLFTLAIKYDFRTPENYRLLGEVLINLGKKNEGLYFIKYATLLEPKAENYHSLIKNLATDFEDKTRKILNKYPNFQLAQHHLCALATFKENLLRRFSG